jgi:hypothetical protein
MSAKQRIDIIDRRRPMSVLVERAALENIAGYFDGRRLPVARSIYLALCELAVGHVADVTRAVVAEYAGVTRKALDEYTPLLEQAYVLKREQRRDGSGGNLPNEWILLDAAEGGTGEGLGSADHPVTSTPSISEDVKVNGEGGRQGVPPADDLVFEAIVSDELRADARQLLAQKRRVDSRVVTAGEMVRAAAAVAAFNAQSGSEFGLGAHLTPVVMRIRERPSWDAAKFVRLVESAWRLRWWEKQRNPRGGRVGVQVVFGNERVFEQVAQDAADEAAGKPLDTSAPTAAKRFTRSD